MKACTTLSIYGLKLRYLRVSRKKSKLNIDDKGEIDCSSYDHLREELQALTSHEGDSCLEINNDQVISKHVVTPHLRSYQAEKMARFQLESKLQGLEQGPYECEVIPLINDKKQSHWLLMAMLRTEVEKIWRLFPERENMGNALKLRGLIEFYRQVAPKKLNIAFCHCENGVMSLFYFSNQNLVFVRQVFIKEEEQEKEGVDELKRSCLLRNVNLPEQLFVDINDQDNLSKATSIQVKDIKLESFAGLEIKKLDKQEFSLLGLASLRLSQKKPDSFYQSIDSNKNKGEELYKRLCVSLILGLIFLSILYLKDMFQLSKAEQQASVVKTEARSLFYKLMPDKKRKFSEQSYLRVLKSRFDKNSSKNEDINLEKFMLSVQNNLNENIEFLMTDLNFQPNNGNYHFEGYVKDLEEFERLNTALRQLKGYTLISNFRKPSKRSPLGLKVSLSLKLKT